VQSAVHYIAHWVFSVYCIFTGCLVKASKASVFTFLLADNIIKLTTRSTARLNWCCSSPAESFLASFQSRSLVKIFVPRLVGSSVMSLGMDPYWQLRYYTVTQPSGWTHRKHGFRQFFYCYVNKCSYADVGFRVPLLRHCLLIRILVTDVSSYWSIPAFSGHTTVTLKQIKLSPTIWMPWHIDAISCVEDC
jgi:hypothetical protein